MSHGVYANFQPIEGTSTGSEQTLSFNRRSRKLVITNDHPTNDLSYKFNDSESFGTLMSTETISLYFRTDKIIINGVDVPYRVWVYG